MTVRELINDLLNCNMDANVDIALTISEEKMKEAVEEGGELYLGKLQIDYMKSGNYPRIILEYVK